MRTWLRTMEEFLNLMEFLVRNVPKGNEHIDFILVDFNVRLWSWKQHLELAKE